MFFELGKNLAVKNYLKEIWFLKNELFSANSKKIHSFVKNKNLSPRLKKLKKGILIKSPFKKKPVAKSA